MKYSVSSRREIIFNVFGAEIKYAKGWKGRLKKGERRRALPRGTVTLTVQEFSNGIQYRYTINIDWKGQYKKENNYHWWVWETENQQDRPPGYIWVSDTPEDITSYQMVNRKEYLCQLLHKRKN